MATVAFYGPNKTTASKVAVGIIEAKDEEASVVERWFAEDGVDIRRKAKIIAEIEKFLKGFNIKSVVVTDGVIGCPHEEGIDYPNGSSCPNCPYWKDRDRWTGELAQ